MRLLRPRIVVRVLLGGDMNEPVVRDTTALTQALLMYRIALVSGQNPIQVDLLDGSERWTWRVSDSRALLRQWMGVP